VGPDQEGKKRNEEEKINLCKDCLIFTTTDKKICQMVFMTFNFDFKTI
jgi:hypothetical protein